MTAPMSGADPGTQRGHFERPNESFAEWLGHELERIGPSSLAAHLDRDRPYDGQPHTDYGERGRQPVEGLTMRDVQDCFIRACYDASGLPPKDWPGSVYDLPWADMSILAVAQNLTCWIERYMGIFPNVPRLLPADPTEPHWCGWPIDSATWRAHGGPCDRPDDAL